MVQDGSKAECLSSVSYTTKFITNKLSIDGRPPFIFYAKSYNTTLNYVLNQMVSCGVTSLNTRFLLITIPTSIVNCQQQNNLVESSMFSFFSDLSGVFFRLFSSFSDRKQGLRITKSKTPLITMLMFSNQEKVD